LTNADLGTAHTLSGLEGNWGRSEAVEAVARLGGGIEGTPSQPNPSHFDPALSYGQTRAAFASELESHYVSWLLARHHGNISAAAREARMDRKHLHDLAKKHDLRSSKMTARP